MNMYDDAVAKKHIIVVVNNDFRRSSLVHCGIDVVIGVYFFEDVSCLVRWGVLIIMHNDIILNIYTW